MQKKCTTWSWLNFRLDAFDPAHLCTTFVINQKRINCNFDNLLVWLKEFQFWPIYQIQLQNPVIPWWPSFDSKKVTCDDNSYQMCRLGPLNGVLIDWKRTKKWYFVTKIVLTYCEKICSSDWEKLLKFEAEGGEFEFFLRSLKWYT